MLGLFVELGNLKKLKRTGWVLRGVSNPESIADHSFRTALITLFLADELKRRGVEINPDKALRIALIHDIGEARITDIPQPALKYVDKSEAERKAVEDLLKTSPLPEEYYQLWLEYEEGSTPEGRLVRFADKLEMLIQALEYESAGASGLDEFWSTLESIRKSEFYGYFKEIVDGLGELRKQKRLL
ncbi:HD domain-containing protein [Thermococcus peptonophilus]|uniref:5'-deoxynucleotidase n=1 Tax=Thermococcus peptonophilus TaxID=53952 RepID=A0A142CUA2_9EURY|nr:HD family hydrolase [Thermococcus peptonophilus]AMQ18354.1 oxetanocin [Thermococcus peptonophilus]